MKTMDMRPAKITDTPQPRVVTKGVISWQAPDFIYYKKSSNWYTYLIVGGLILVVIFYLIGRVVGVQIFIASLAVVIAAIASLFTFANAKPESIDYTLSEEGIAFKGKLYKFTDLKSFLIIDDRGIFKLIIEQAGRFKPALIVIINNIDPNKIRNTFLKKLPENSDLSGLVNETISNFLKF